MKSTVPLKVLHLIPGLERDGAEYQLYLNIRYLDRARHENYVCHLFPRTELAADIEKAGAQVFSVASGGPFGFFLKIWKLVRLIRKLDIDVVHGSNVQGELYGGIAGKLTRRRVVATLTNISYEDVWLQDNPSLNRAKLRWVAFWRKLVLRRLHDRYIAISDYVRQSAESGFGLDKSRIDVIYRGLPEIAVNSNRDEVAATRRSIAESEFDGKDAYPLILNVGRLVAQKGQRYLIEALPAVLKEHPGARVIIAGEGPLESSLRRLAGSLGVEDEVRFLGRRQDVQQLLAAADMFVFPSLFEGFGVALLEACRAGKPCIATSSGPLPEIIMDGETGVLVPRASSEDLAAAIVRLASDRELSARLGRASAERARNQFGIEVAVDKLGRTYATLMGGKLESAAVNP